MLFPEFHPLVYLNSDTDLLTAPSKDYTTPGFLTGRSLLSAFLSTDDPIFNRHIGTRNACLPKCLELKLQEPYYVRCS